MCANRVRQIQAMVAGAQHNLCRPERTRRNHHHPPGTHHARFGDGMPWGITLVLNPVPAASDRLDIAYSNLREDLRSVVLGDGKVVHVKRVFCTDIAPRDAIAAVDAGMALDPILVDAIARKIHS